MAGHTPGHTPGPWHVYVDQFTGKIDRYPGIEAQGMTIVLFGEERDRDLGVHGKTPEESLANAHLIAAAPDLLAATKALLAECDPARTCDPETGWFREVTSAGLEQARAAVAKAEGRS